MLQVAVTLLQWLPGTFIWLFCPIAFLSLVLASTRRWRAQAALGFIVAASVSAIFLAIETAAFGYVCCDQARMLFSILLDFRPGVTIGFAFALFGSIVKPFAGSLPMLIGAAASGAAAFALRRGRGTAHSNSDQPAVLRQTGTVS